MKLLASDYDNTLKCNILDLKINIYYLKKFIEDGNIFLLNQQLLNQYQNHLQLFLGVL